MTNKTVVPLGDMSIAQLQQYELAQMTAYTNREIKSKEYDEIIARIARAKIAAMEKATK